MEGVYCLKPREYQTDLKRWALFGLLGKVGIVSVIKLLGVMLAYLEFRISDTLGWPQGMFYRSDYSMIKLYACV